MIERGSSATTIGELWEKQGLLLMRPVVYTECLWPLNEVVGRERRKRERSRKGEEGKKEREGEVGEREMKRERERKRMDQGSVFIGVKGRVPRVL